VGGLGDQDGIVGVTCKPHLGVEKKAGPADGGASVNIEQVLEHLHQQYVFDRETRSLRDPDQLIPSGWKFLSIRDVVLDTSLEAHAVVSCRHRQLLYCTRSMRNISAEFLTVLSTYLEPTAFAGDNTWPFRMFGHWLGFSFLMTPSSSTQGDMSRGRMPCIAQHESSWTSSSSTHPCGTKAPAPATPAGPGAPTRALPR